MTPQRINKVGCEYQTSVQLNKRSKKATSTYVTAAQRKKLIQDLGTTCYIVFSVYVEKAGVKRFDFLDKRIAKTLGIHERKIQRARRGHISFGWFYQKNFYTRDTKQKLIVTYLGQAVVHDTKNSKDLLGA